MRSLGRNLVIMLCAVVVLVATSAVAQARAGSQYRIEGRGWGHGIGMSQYGAQGYAKQGWTFDQIISHYYQGSVIATRPTNGPTNLRVLLQSHLSPAQLQLTSAGIVKQGAVTVDLLPGDIVTMQSVGANLVTTRMRQGAPDAVIAAGSSADATIVPHVDGGVRILFAADHAGFGTAFRGVLTGHRFEGKVSVINTLDFESYLRGVVPDEMPPSWHPEALKAQAIAARSYALRSLRTDYNWFDVYSDTRSQVYGGVGAEEESTDAAIAATAAQVARVGTAAGEVVHAFFFSTSGSRTAGNDEVWGSSPFTYLRSVRSPYEQASPYFYWRGSEVKRFTPRQMGEALGYDRSFRGVSNTVYRSGYARDVIVRTSAGAKVERASSIQARLGLRSTFFRINYLSITGPDSAPAGGFVKLSGRVPVAGLTTLQLRQNGRVISLRAIPRDASGRWVVRTRLRGDLTAILTRAGVRGPAVKVLVAQAPATEEPVDVIVNGRR